MVGTVSGFRGDWTPDAARTPPPGPAPAAELAEKYRGQWDIVAVGEGVSLVAVERLTGQPQPAIVVAESAEQMDRQLTEHREQQ